MIKKIEKIKMNMRTFKKLLNSSDCKPKEDCKNTDPYGLFGIPIEIDETVADGCKIIYEDREVNLVYTPGENGL
ncbi:MAG: hypothetical protein RSH78_00040 [Bacilli bacterium]|uniref:hypothetical protein n=1 Tax=Clostridium sp. TaxID=1506 RepID=UPI002FC9ED0E